jgi:hypothetical protein
MSTSPPPPSAAEVVVTDTPAERIVLRRSAGQFTLVVERVDSAGRPVHQQLTLSRVGMTHAIEAILNKPRPSIEPSLTPLLDDSVLFRVLRIRAESGDSRAVRQLHLLLGEADQHQTGFRSAQRALHRLAYLPLASREPWGCWSDTLRGHGAQSYAAMRLVAMAAYVNALTAAELAEYQTWLTNLHQKATGTTPDIAAVRSDMMLRVVHILAPDRVDWLEYSIRIDLAQRIRDTPPKRPRELALLTLRALGFDGPKAHDFLKGARRSTRGWRWPLFGATQTPTEPPNDFWSDGAPPVVPKRKSTRAAKKNFKPRRRPAR